MNQKNLRTWRTDQLAFLSVGYFLISACQTSLWRFSRGRIFSGDLYLPNSLKAATIWFKDSFSTVAPTLASTTQREQGFYWVRLIYLGLLSATRNPAFSERLFFTLIQFVAMLAMFFFLKFLGLRKSLQVIGGILFATLPTNYNFLAFGWYVILLQSALVPMVIICLYSIIQEKQSRTKIFIVGHLCGLVLFSTSLLPGIVFLCIVLLITVIGTSNSRCNPNNNFPVAQIVGFASSALLSNAFWVINAAIQSTFGTRRFIGISANSVALGASSNVRWHTPITQWGTGFNSSFEISLTSLGIGPWFKYVLPGFAILGLVGKWNLRIPKAFFQISITVLVLLASTDQSEIISTLSKFGLGRDSGRLYAVGGVLLIPLAMNGLGKIAALVDEGVAFAFSTIVALLFIVPYVHPGLSSSTRPTEPALSWPESKILLEDYNSLVKFLDKNALDLPVLHFPTSELVIYKDDQRFKLPYHTFPAFVYPSRTIWNSSSPGFLQFRNLIDEVTLTGGATELARTAIGLGAKFIVFDRFTATSNELMLLDRIESDSSLARNLRDITVDVFNQPSSRFQVYKVIERSLPVEASVDGDVQRVEFRKSSRYKYQLLVALRASRKSQELEIRLSEGFREDWEASIKGSRDVLYSCLANHPTNTDFAGNLRTRDGTESLCFSQVYRLIKNKDVSHPARALTHRPDSVHRYDNPKISNLTGFNYFTWKLPPSNDRTILVQIELPTERRMNKLVKFQFVIEILAALVILVGLSGQLRPKH